MEHACRLGRPVIRRSHTRCRCVLPSVPLPATAAAAAAVNAMVAVVLPLASLPGWLRAWQVMEAVNTGNYHRFFILYNATPNMGMYVTRPVWAVTRYLLCSRVSTSLLKCVCASSGSAWPAPHCSVLFTCVCVCVCVCVLCVVCVFLTASGAVVLPAGASYILDYLLHEMRSNAYTAIIHAYAPSITCEFVRVRAGLLVARSLPRFCRGA